ncbi:hypothetical protein B7463_g1537, partial [Scytalidium lignicola]
MNASPQRIMECKIGSSLPQQTRQTDSDVLDVDYNELWERVRAAKRILPDRGELRMAEDKDEDGEGASEAATQITDSTSIQPHKTSPRYAEEMLHPRWIAISEDMREDEMEHLEIQLDLHCASDDGATTLESGPRTIQNNTGELFAEITSEQSEKIDSSLKYLNAFGALEAQWEQRIWRPFFLKDIQGTPMDHNGRAQGHQIQQAKLSFHDRCVLPPLLSRQNDRRASRRISGSVSWFPDYLYALGLSHLTDLAKRLTPRVYRLPSARIAQFECSPSYFMAEIKRDVDQEPAAKQYLAFLGAYTLHEDQQHHQTSSEDQERLEPIRYDLQLLDEIDIARSRDRQQLADWINLIHYYGSTKHLAALQNDVRAATLKLGNTGKTDWMAGIAFVYSNDEGTEIRAVQQSDLLKAYHRGDLEPEGDISDEVLARGLSIGKMSSEQSEEGKDAVSLALSKLPSPPDSAASTSPDTRRRNRSPQKKYPVT